MIDKETQRIAWSCLPKEFKEEVKKEYAKCMAIDIDDNPNLPAYAVESATSRRALLEMLFGEHNLTSDAEGEEMLVVKAETVRNMYAANERIKVDFLDKETSEASDHINHVLRFLFGSKCLPDEKVSDSTPLEEPKEPKHHKGDKVYLDMGVSVEITDVMENTDGFGYEGVTKKGECIVFVDDNIIEPILEVKVRNIQEEYVTVCNSKDVEIVTTNNPLVFDDIRLQIGTKQLKGYYIIHRGKEYPIQPNGQIWPWPDGLFDKQFTFSGKLITLALELDEERDKFIRGTRHLENDL